MNISRFTTSDGVEIAAKTYGDSGHQTLLLLHGAGQTKHAWHSTATALAASGYRAITVDTRGHGDSDWSDTGDYSIDTLKHDLITIIECLVDFGIEQPVVVGASLGGITALLAEGEAPGQLFSALVLVDVTPRMDPDGVARILRFMSEFSGGFESLEQASEAVAGYQPHRKQTAIKDNTGLKKNLRLRADGRFYWHWDPGLLDHVSQFGEEFVNRQYLAAQQLRLPVLLVHGKLSDVVSTETAEEFLRQVPQASYVDVADAAHMVASDNNEVFAEAVIEFLQRDLAG